MPVTWAQPRDRAAGRLRQAVLCLGWLAGWLAGMLKGGPKGKSVGKRQDKTRQLKAQSVQFADAGGVEQAKAELMDIVSFIRDPAKYTGDV
jgi:ATP-dependent Zn protease